MTEKASATLSIGQVAARTGLAVSALRFYEDSGLLHPTRNAGGQRRFRRSDIRRVSFIMIAAQLGFTLPEIRAQLDALPANRTPTQRDWARISRAFRGELDRRIGGLVRMRERLDGCIGCGCLSLANCALYNPEDRAGQRGPGPRYLLEDDR
ncbi:MAG: redox-sensitive transcriptional activator SoxR [Pseudomonadota bacterium]